MATEIAEPTGKVASRVTIVTTLTSMLPTIFTCAMIVTAFLIGMSAAAMLVTALGLGSAITGTVFGTAKNTPTD